MSGREQQQGGQADGGRTPPPDDRRDAAGPDVARAPGVTRGARGERTTGERTTDERTTSERTTDERTTSQATTGHATTGERTTGERTTGQATTGLRTTDGPTTDEATTDSGRHAVQRPVPTPPPAAPGDDDARPAPADGTAAAPAAVRTAGPASRRDDAPAPAPRDGEPGPTARRAEAAGARPDEAPGDGRVAAPDGRPADTADGELFPDAHAPRTSHVASHVLGTLLGLVLAPFAVVTLLLGQSRVLEVQVDGWDASLELLGIVLVTAAALLTAGILALGVWSAAAPGAAGVVVLALGSVQLYAPGVARTATLDLLGSDAWSLTLKQATVAGTSGTTFVVGALLLTGAVVMALARRSGVRLGTLRERHRAHLERHRADPATTHPPGTVHDPDEQD